MVLKKRLNKLILCVLWLIIFQGIVFGSEGKPISFIEDSVAEKFKKNYFEGDISEFCIQLINTGETEESFVVTYMVEDEKGNALHEETDEEEYLLAPMEKEIITYRYTPKYFGELTLKVKMRGLDSRREETAEKKFMYIKRAEKNQEVGIHSDFFNNDKTREFVLPMYEKAGFGSRRWCIAWYEFEDEKGVYKLPAGLDEEVELAKSIDFHDMMQFGLGNPHWTKNSTSNVPVAWNKTMPVGDEQLRAWYDYCYNLVIETKDYAESYEVWNEPNVKTFNLLDATPEDYAKMLKSSYHAVRDAGADAKIVGFAVSGMGVDYINEVLECCDKLLKSDTLIGGDTHYIDVIAVHPYCFAYTHLPENGIQFMDDPETHKLFENAENLKNNLAERGLDIPIWFTEFGWHERVGVENQAIYTLRSFILNKVHNTAEKIFLFKWMENTGKKTQDYNTTFGIINAEDSENPYMADRTFAAMASYNSLMRDVVYDKTISVDEQKLYMFTLPDNRKLLAFWSDSNSKTIGVNLNCDEVLVYDMYGNCYTQKGIDGKFSFFVSDKPIYIVGKFNNAQSCDNLFDLGTYNIDICEKDSEELEFFNYTGEHFDIVAEASCGINITNTSVPEKFVLSENDSNGKEQWITLIAQSGENIYYKGEAKVTIHPENTFILSYEDFNNYACMQNAATTSNNGALETYDDFNTLKAYSTFGSSRWEQGAWIDRAMPGVMRIDGSFGRANFTESAGFKVLLKKMGTNTGKIKLDFDMAVIKQLSDSCVDAIAYFEVAAISAGENVPIMRIDKNELFYGSELKKVYTKIPNDLEQFNQYSIVFDFEASKLSLCYNGFVIEESALPDKIKSYGIDSFAFYNTRRFNDDVKIGTVSERIDNLSVIHFKFENNEGIIYEADLVRNGEKIEISEVSEKDTVSVKVYTQFKSEEVIEDTELICAVYNNDRLSGVTVVPDFSGGQTTVYTIENIEVKSCDNLMMRFFLWDKNTQRPLAKTHTIKNY